MFQTAQSKSGMDWPSLWHALTGEMVEDVEINAISNNEPSSKVDFVELFNPGNFKAQKGTLIAGGICDVKVNPSMEGQNGYWLQWDRETSITVTCLVGRAGGPRLDSTSAKRILQDIAAQALAPLEVDLLDISKVMVALARILILVMTLVIKLGAQYHFDIVVHQFLARNLWVPENPESTDEETASIKLAIPSSTVWKWLPHMYGLKRLCWKSNNWRGSSVEGGRPESAGNTGRVCEICYLESKDLFCQERNQVLTSLEDAQQDPEFGESLLPAIHSLQQWSREIPTWELLQGLMNLMKPSVRRINRSRNPHKGPFVVFEGVDGAGKTFHMDVVQEFLVNNHFSVHKLVFPNLQTELGRFLKTCMRESRLWDVWTQHVLFSLHRWEFMQWMTDILERGGRGHSLWKMCVVRPCIFKCLGSHLRYTDISVRGYGSISTWLGGVYRHRTYNS